MAKHIYLESSLPVELSFVEISTLTGSYFEKIEDNYDKAIISSVSVDLENGQKWWCAEIIDGNSYPIIKYYHFKNLSDLVATYYANGYNFIINIKPEK